MSAGSRSSDRPLDPSASARPWVIFASAIAVVFVLSWAKPVLIPLTLATLLTFVLNPAVSFLQRGIGRIAASVLVVTLVTGGIGLGGWVAVRQVATLIEELPEYRTTIRRKVADVRGASSTGPVGRLQAALDDIQKDIEGPKPTKPPTPVVVNPETGPLGLPAWLVPLFNPLAAAGLVFVLVTFMLVEWQELRNRLIRLIGQKDVAATSRAFSEAGTRVLRQLRMQLLVNLIYGAALGGALFLIGVPYALLWASLAAALRFVPYLGPFVGAAGPLLISLAVFPGWTVTLWVLSAIVALELFTNIVLETVLYAGTGGVSQTALLVGIAFWTWIWGPLGLLMATPLTVCLVVLGKHLRPLRILGTLMAEAPSLSSDRGLYQRIVSRDTAGASAQVEVHLKGDSPAGVFDSLLIPALASAERDAAQGRLPAADYAAVIGAIEAFVESAATSLAPPAPEGADAVVRTTADTDAHADAGPVALRATGARSLDVLAIASSTASEAVAFRMIEVLLGDAPVRLTIHPAPPDISEIEAALRTGRHAAVCIAELAARPSARARYLVKRLRAAARVPIVVLRLAPAEPAGGHLSTRLRESGAVEVTTTLRETTERLSRLADHDRRASIRAVGVPG